MSIPGDSSRSGADDAARELRKITAMVGAPETGGVLFASRMAPVEVHQLSIYLLQQFGWLDGAASVGFDFAHIPMASVGEWGARCWTNTLNHLSEVDPAVRQVFTKHLSFMPDDDEARQLLMQKAYAAWRFFLWVHVSPSKHFDPENYCTCRLIVLDQVILLEDLSAKRNGQFGGQGLLDKSLAGIRDLASSCEIKRIKAVATNERVYRALRKRGFRDHPAVDGLERHVQSYAKPVELVLACGPA
ncbi:MAG TPA: hypothetical protein VG734_09960 [Lacunisphaera sp.]|nr:hypothetical protein [Lacunisphaera sp.]